MCQACARVPRTQRMEPPVPGGDTGKQDLPNVSSATKEAQKRPRAGVCDWSGKSVWKAKLMGPLSGQLHEGGKGVRKTGLHLPQNSGSNLTSSCLVFRNPRQSSPHCSQHGSSLKRSSDHAAAPLPSHENSVFPSGSPPSSCPGSRPRQLYFLSLPSH